MTQNTFCVIKPLSFTVHYVFHIECSGSLWQSPITTGNNGANLLMPMYHLSGKGGEEEEGERRTGEEEEVIEGKGEEEDVMKICKEEDEGGGGGGLDLFLMRLTVC